MKSNKKLGGRNFRKNFLIKVLRQVIRKNFNLSTLFRSAKNIFVIEASAISISEFISSGKPAITIFPSDIKSPMRYKAHIQKYLDLGFITIELIEAFFIKEIENSSVNVQNHLSKLRD